jgi:excisionase family DNA binding protein
MSSTTEHIDSRTVLTVAQVADLLQCQPKAVRSMIARGELRAYRPGGARMIRIRRADLERAMRPVTNAADLRAGEAAA